ELDEELGFDALYARVGPRLWRAVLAYTGGDRDITDDVVAEAFARTLGRIADVRTPEAYLFRVAFRLAARELRRSPTTPEVSERGARTSGGDPGSGRRLVAAVVALAVAAASFALVVTVFWGGDARISTTPQPSPTATGTTPTGAAALLDPHAICQVPAFDPDV